MKKLTYLVVAAAVWGMVACTGQPGYVVTGTVEGAVEGDTVLLQEVSGRQLVSLDTAIITNGTFTFKGTQDSVVSRYVTYPKGNETLRMDFFLENGKINMALTKENYSATGTPNNDAYQVVRGKLNALNAKGKTLFESMADTTLTDEQRAEKSKELNALEEEMTTITKEGINTNITNPVGVMLFKKNYYSLDNEECDALLQQIPAAYQNDEVIVKIKEITEKKKETAVGKKFAELEMLTPEGKPVKLSDYVGKGKVVLIDFWASWCGPCRREMPNLVEAYKQYKDKNFEIVGVSFDQTGDAWKDGIKKLGITWPQMSDLKYWNSEGAKVYAINSIPHTILIDGEGTIIARGLHGDELNAKLAEVIK